MRVKKQKRHRKTVRFFSACFGFREPFKILCDGTFVHHLLAHDLTPADDALAHLLGARTLLFTTGCVVGELKSLGKSYSDSLRAAHQLVTARCDHEKRVNAAACIEAVVAEGNPEHFFVATQDADLRKKFREIPGIPVIYGLRNSLFLEKPSTVQREFVKSTEEKRLRMSESEHQKLHKITLKNRLDTADLSADDESGKEIIAQASRNSTGRQKMLGVSDNSKFKRKRAKGPNPLSCKKKKSKDDSARAQNHVKDGESGSGPTRKRTRKRKKAAKDSKPGESVSS